MKFNNWTLNEFIEYLKKQRSNCYWRCRPRISGEIYIFNGERYDGKEDKNIFDE